MRRCLYLLLPLAFPATAAIPVHLADPVLNARLPALVQRFKETNKSRETLARQPVATATWDCPVDSKDLLTASGIYLEGLDATSRQNAVRQGHPPLKTGNIVIVPLGGSCQEGKLMGPVAFWAQLDQDIDDPSYPKYSARVFQRISFTLHGESPATDLQAESLTLITRSSNKYIKTNGDPDEGSLVVMWSSVANSFRYMPGQASLSLMSVGKGAPTLVSRQEKAPGVIETQVYAAATTPIRDRYDATGALVERHIGDVVRYYVTADGNWKAEPLKGPGTVAATTPTPATAAATTPAAPGQRGSFNRIDGNTGRYLSPITSKGLPAAWVGRTSDGNGVGTTLGGMAGSYVGEKALQQVPFVGGFLGRKAGEAAARKMAQQAAGGEAYMRETSDLSFNTIDDMAGFLATHAGDPGFDVVLKAATRVYPELNDAYLRALRAR